MRIVRLTTSDPKSKRTSFRFPALVAAEKLLSGVSHFETAPNPRAASTDPRTFALPIEQERKHENKQRVRALRPSMRPGQSARRRSARHSAHRDLRQSPVFPAQGALPRRKLMTVLYPGRRSGGVQGGHRELLVVAPYGTRGSHNVDDYKS